MKQKYIKANIFLLILLIFFTVSLLSFVSYEIFLNNFKNLEKEQNSKNIITTLTTLDKELKYIEDITRDYALWDDTYNFINTNDNDYVYENFRDGANTLEDLELNFMIYTNLKNEKIFSKYTNELLKNISLNLENEIIIKYKKFHNLATIHKYVDNNGKINYIYLVKKHISNSDDTANPNGFIFSGRVFNNEEISKINKSFKNISIIKESNFETDLTTNSKYFKDIKIKTAESNSCECLENLIQINDEDGNFILTLFTQSTRDLINEGKKTIFTYNLILFIFLVLIFILLYNNQKLLENYSDKLKAQVDKKTKELQETNQKLKFLSETDELTGINNRRNFFKLGTKALEKAIIENKDISIIMIDLDNFKNVNDTYGHTIGDKVLIEFTTIVLNSLDEKHIFGRLGGEEFSIILNDLSDEESFEYIENIRKKIEKSKIHLDNEELNYTVSIGMVFKNETNNLDKLLQEADKLLYKAKKRGKNCTIIRGR